MVEDFLEEGIEPPLGVPNSPEIRAGNISRYYSSWSQITDNNFILRIIREGYKIQFINNPSFPSSVISSPSNSEKRLALRTQINKHLSTGAISEIQPHNDHVLSRVFTVKKSNGEDRMIIDLSLINTQINKVSFKMETYENILDILQPLDYMASIDLSDAFFSVPLHNESKKYVVFEFENKRYSFNVLPFGMTSSPRIFSKVLRVAIIHLRSLGIKILSYLDDIFLCASDSISLKSNITTTLNLLTSLGFYPNFSKSSLTPSHCLCHLGFVWNTCSMTLSVPEEKISKAKNLASRLLNSSPSLRDISSFIGLVVSLRPAFTLAPLHYRHLQFLQCSYIKKEYSWDSNIILNNDAISDLKWWSSCPKSLSPASIKPFKPDFTLCTDSSKKGWGGVLSSGESVSGIWSHTESLLHINYLELKAIHFCILSFLPFLKNKNISIKTDNITTVFYMNKIGGTHSRDLCFLALEIWQLLTTYQINCKTFHIPGIQNVEADGCSRKTLLINDYSLSKKAFTDILALIEFVPTVDLFASRLTAKLPLYISQFYDPFSYKVNAFSISWPNNIYIFPPINLISKVVQKIIEGNLDNVLLVTPAWPGLISLPTIISMLFDNPIFIPSHYLEGCLPTRHPFHLMAWCISTKLQKTEAYQRTLHPISSRASLRLRLPHIIDTGNNLTHSLIKGGHKVRFLLI